MLPTSDSNVRQNPFDLLPDDLLEIVLSYTLPPASRATPSAYPALLSATPPIGMNRPDGTPVDHGTSLLAQRSSYGLHPDSNKQTSCSTFPWSLVYVSKRIRRAFLRCIARVCVGGYHARAPHSPKKETVRALTNILEGPLRHCPRLRHLTLGCCDGLTNAQIIPFAKAAQTSITSLRLQACAGVTDMSSLAIANHLCAPDFKELELVCHPTRPYNMLTDATLNIFARKCPSIQALRIWMWSLGRHGAIAISSLENLAHLKLRGVAGLSDAILEIIVSRCASLREIQLTNAPELTNATAQAIATGPSANKLVGFQLTNNDNIDDDFVLTLTEECYMLEFLHFGTCLRLSDGSAAGIKRLSNLRTLALINTRSITDHLLRGVYGCNQLNSLRLDFCTNITSAGLAPLCRLPGLREISISFSNSIGLGTARVLAECQELISVGLAKTNMDDEALHVLCTGLAAQKGVLKRVNVRRCPSVSQAAVRDLLEEFPKLTIISDHTADQDDSI